MRSSCGKYIVDVAIYLRLGTIVLGPISIILNFSKKHLVKADITQLSSKIFLKIFDENWRNTSHIHNRCLAAAPPPSHLSLISGHICILVQMPSLKFESKWTFFHIITYICLKKWSAEVHSLILCLCGFISNLSG